MREPDRHTRASRTGAYGGPQHQGKGIPDGLLLGGLGFLLGLTALCWTATGLAGLLSQGGWPDGVSFTRTPMAVRALLAHPHDIASAWPDTPAGELPGYGLFWGLFISQVMVLIVLTVFVLGTCTRWRAVRRARRAAAPKAASTEPWTPASTPAPETRPAAPAPTARVPDRLRPGGHLHIGLDHSREAAQTALRDAEGAVLVVTADPELYTSTVGARAKLGPVHVYDPLRLTDAPARLRWAPHQHCADMAVARVRADALLAPVRSPGRTHDPEHDTARTMLRCWLHAASVAGEPFREVHRWALSGSTKDAVRILRGDTRAAAGAAGELESALTAHPERRTAAEELVRKALSCTSRVHIRNACTPSQNEADAWASFVHERGTLYAVGEPIEAPHRDGPGAMPLLTALASAVVEHGRLVAERSSAGRLDPPLVVLLDHPATVAPLPELPALLADGEAVGLHAVTFLRSEEQKHLWWNISAGS